MFFIWQEHVKHPVLSGFVQDDAWEPIRFDTKEEAEKYLETPVDEFHSVFTYKVVKLVDA